MSKNIKASILLVVLLPLSSGVDLTQPGMSLALNWESTVYAQTTAKYPYKTYGNRKEGIIKSRQLVAGEQIVLVGASIENNEPAPQPEGADYKLAFYLEGASGVEIVVREFEKLYKMAPLRTEYPAGLSTFAWPSEIPRYYGIAIPHLFPLATVAGTDGERIVPVMLFCAAPKDTALIYRFCFVPLKTVSVLQYKIYFTGSLQPAFSGTLRDLEADRQAYLRWAGKDQNSRPVRNGLYTLVLEPTFKPLPGEQAVKVTSTYEFYHYAEILKSNSAVRQ
ncbi:hypothetical protein L0337_22225 [candidate division KSB1 bacterium]|nr:hypothetical protein [candidate division KSB1 bacterium]